LSGKSKGDRTLGKGLELAFLVIFGAILIGGALYIALYPHELLPTKPEIVLAKIKIVKSVEYA